MSNACLTSSLQDIVTYISSEKISALPTDTVFGLFCSMDSQKAKERLYQLKDRNKNKTLAIYVNSLKEIENIILRPLNPQELKLAEAFLPGPLSLVLKNNNPDFIEDTLTFRIVNHPIIQQLVSSCGPLAGTSANISNSPPALSSKEVIEDFSSEDICVFDGDCSEGLESTVVSADPLILYREGIISCSLIEACMQAPILKTSISQHSFIQKISIQVLQSTADLENFLKANPKQQSLVCENPSPKNFFPFLRKALRSQVPSILFVYDPKTSPFPELSPYLSPYLIKEPVSQL